MLPLKWALKSTKRGINEYAMLALIMLGEEPSLKAYSYSRIGRMIEMTKIAFLLGKEQNAIRGYQTDTLDMSARFKSA